jgi:hypothetical protein
MRPALAAVAAAVAITTVLLTASAPAHYVNFAECEGPFRWHNSSDHVVVIDYIDFHNPNATCDEAKRIVHIFVSGETPAHWSCHAHGIRGTWGFGRGNCLHGHSRTGRPELHYPWYVIIK